MKKKRDYKTVQIGFRDKYAYDSFHKKAVRYCGCDSRLADCMYLRECIKANEKKKRASSKKKAQEFVKAQGGNLDNLKISDKVFSIKSDKEGYIKLDIDKTVRSVVENGISPYSRAIRYRLCPSTMISPHTAIGIMILPSSRMFSSS